MDILSVLVIAALMYYIGTMAKTDEKVKFLFIISLINLLIISILVILDLLFIFGDIEIYLLILFAIFYSLTGYVFISKKNKNKHENYYPGLVLYIMSFLTYLFALISQLIK